MTQQDKHVLTESFEQARHLWAQRYPRLVGIAATSLVILENDATFNCPRPDGTPNRIQASDPGGTQYCEALGKVVVTEGLVSYLDGITTNTRPLLKFFVFHEETQAVQGAQGALQPGIPTTILLELQADCGAGVAAKALDPASIPAIHAFFPWLPPNDPRHGTWEQHRASFDLGAASGHC